MQLVSTKSKIAFEVQEIRSQFPILHRKINNKPLVFLDNASTTQKPKAVTDTLLDYYQTYNANIHRGIYTLSQEATVGYEQTRDAVASFINAVTSTEVIFTRNTTESLNLIAYSWGKHNLIAGDDILLTEMEHHSNLLPWQRLAKEIQATLHFLPINVDGRLVTERLRSLVTPRTKLVSLTHISNVLGTINDIKKITAEIKTLNPKTVVVVDGAQAVGHRPVDVQDLGVDFYAFSAHKMYGPTGVGVLWGKGTLLEKMPPFLTGGDMVDQVSFKDAVWASVPQKFEAGTPNIADVVAFKKALDFLTAVGLDVIQRYEEDLTVYALERLGDFDKLRLYGPKDSSRRSGVFSFNLGRIHSHDLASILDEDGVCIRSGHHCAQPLLNRLGVTSAARMSVAVYNTKEEIEKFIKALKKAETIIK